MEGGRLEDGRLRRVGIETHWRWVGTVVAFKYRRLYAYTLNISHLQSLYDCRYPSLVPDVTDVPLTTQAHHGRLAVSNDE